ASTKKPQDAVVIYRQILTLVNLEKTRPEYARRASLNILEAVTKILEKKIAKLEPANGKTSSPVEIDVIDSRSLDRAYELIWEEAGLMVREGRAPRPLVNTRHWDLSINTAVPDFTNEITGTLYKISENLKNIFPGLALTPKDLIHATLFVFITGIKEGQAIGVEYELSEEMVNKVRKILNEVGVIKMDIQGINLGTNGNIFAQGRVSDERLFDLRSRLDKAYPNPQRRSRVLNISLARIAEEITPGQFKDIYAEVAGLRETYFGSVNIHKPQLIEVFDRWGFDHGRHITIEVERASSPLTGADDKLHVIFISPEVSPISRTGGLGDVSHDLPFALSRMDVDVTIFSLRYEDISTVDLSLVETMPIYIGNDEIKVNARMGSLDGVRLCLLDDNFGYSSRLYQGDTLRQSIILSNGTFEATRRLYKRGVIARPYLMHPNDWQAGLVPAYLKTRYYDDEVFAAVASLFSIHNLAYQGEFARERFGDLGIGWEHWNGFVAPRNPKNLNLLKAALFHSDKINAVSERYAQEIRTAQFGEGLENILMARGTDLTGILNGINLSSADIESWRTRHERKQELQEAFGLTENPDMPLLAMATSRITEQKNQIMTLRLVERLLTEMDGNMQFILIGKGHPDDPYFYKVKSHAQALAADKRWIGHVAYKEVADFKTSRTIFKGADIFLMPSKFEPCGLAQMAAMAFGCVPVVSYTGGLADTVREFDPVTGKGTGFVFENNNENAFHYAALRAISIYQHNKAMWRRIIGNAQAEDRSWTRSAKKYLALYLEALRRKAAYVPEDSRRRIEAVIASSMEQHFSGDEIVSSPIEGDNATAKLTGEIVNLAIASKKIGFAWADNFYRQYKSQKDNADFTKAFKEALKILLFNETEDVRAGAAWVLSQPEFLGPVPHGAVGGWADKSVLKVILYCESYENPRMITDFFRSADTNEKREWIVDQIISAVVNTADQSKKNRALWALYDIFGLELLPLNVSKYHGRLYEALSNGWMNPGDEGKVAVTKEDPFEIRLKYRQMNHFLANAHLRLKSGNGIIKDMPLASADEVIEGHPDTFIWRIDSSHYDGFIDVELTITDSRNQSTITLEKRHFDYVDKILPESISTERIEYYPVAELAGKKVAVFTMEAMLLMHTLFGAMGGGLGVLMGCFLRALRHSGATIYIPLPIYHVGEHQEVSNGEPVVNPDYPLDYSTIFKGYEDQLESWEKIETKKVAFRLFNRDISTDVTMVRLRIKGSDQDTYVPFIELTQDVALRLYPEAPTSLSRFAQAAFYARAALKALEAFDITPDIFQVHESFAALSLIPDLFRNPEFKDNPRFKEAKGRIMGFAHTVVPQAFPVYEPYFIDAVLGLRYDQYSDFLVNRGGHPAYDPFYALSKVAVYVGTVGLEHLGVMKTTFPEFQDKYFAIEDSIWPFFWMLPEQIAQGGNILSIGKIWEAKERAEGTLIEYVKQVW
ncbi:MAG: glycogen synthase, partial [Deltaproteobacteria bacterium]